MTVIAARDTPAFSRAQLFTYRRVSINPQSDLFEPLLDATPAELQMLLPSLLAVFPAPRAPRIPNLRSLMERTAPSTRRVTRNEAEDPFDLGEVREGPDDLEPAVAAAVQDILAAVKTPVSLAQLLAHVGDTPGTVVLDPAQRRRVLWMLAVTVASGYGTTDAPEPGTPNQFFDPGRLAVIKTGHPLHQGPVGGDDLVVIPRVDEAIRDREA